ncbi:MAG: LLM class flavin-dependent oxidoreductase [Pseudomonadota bacterium]
MDIYYTPLWQDPGAGRPPQQFVQDELWLMEQVEGFGFDACCSPEHHFDIDYSACPDNFLPLAYLAGKTTTLKLCLGAVILPWNDPLRAAEKLAFLDHLSAGRCIPGFGRGLARMEYELLGIDMNESRARFDEAVAMVLGALRTGEIEGSGPYYPQARAPIHPAPRPGLLDNFLCVGMSPDSAAMAGQLGARLLSFTSKPLPQMLPLYGSYAEAFRANHPGKTPHYVLADFFMVRDSADEALDLAMKYVVEYFHTVVRHYDMTGEHFDNATGYRSYAADAAALREAGAQAAAESYVLTQVGIGTPAQVLEKIEERLRVLGPEISLAGCFYYSGMPRELAQASMRMFSEQVIRPARDLARDAQAAVLAA